MKTLSPRLALLSLLSVFGCLGICQAQDDGAFSVPSIGPEAFEVMRDFFAYDEAIPLNARISGSADFPEYHRETIVFTARDARVPGYLAIPNSGSPPYPCVMLLHGLGGSKEDWFVDDSYPSGGLLTRKLIESGFAVLALDAVYHGERTMPNDFESPVVFTLERGWLNRTRDMTVQSVVDYRRAIDYLSTRTEIDADRLGAIGFSMGGMMTFILSAVEPRIKVSVASVTPILKGEYSAMSVHNFAPYVRSSGFLMLMGETDSSNYTPVEAQQVRKLLPGEEHELVFFDSGHILPPEWTTTATEWMVKHLE